MPVNLYFTPKADYEVNFNIVCGVKRKIEPLRLNVKAEGYCMNAMVVCEDSVGSRIELSPQGVNAINFGNVEINEESIRNITVFNAGKFNFDYEWELIERFVNSKIIKMAQRWSINITVKTVMSVLINTWCK